MLLFLGNGGQPALASSKPSAANAGVSKVVRRLRWLLLLATLLVVTTSCSGPAQATATPLPPGTPAPQPTPVFTSPQQQTTPTGMAMPSPTGEVQATTDAGTTDASAAVQAALAVRIAQKQASIRATLEAAPATATMAPTPVPANTDFSDMPSVVGIVRSDSTLFAVPQGSAVTSLSIATTLTIFGRSADSMWYTAVTKGGQTGWIQAEKVSVYGDADQLAIIAMAEVSADSNASNAAGTEPVAADTGTGSAGPAPSPPGNLPDNAAVVSVESLNVRAGPGTNYPVVAVLQQNETILLRARNQAGDWLQIELAGVAGGTGWVYTPLVTTAVEIESLAISTAVSTQPSAAPAAADSTIAGAAENPAEGLAVQTTPINGLRGTLVFQERSGGTIYRYTLQTGLLAPVTNGADPAISPDGQTIAFVRGGGEAGLYLIDIDGSNERRIFTGDQPAAPKWSPDGRMIVFNHASGKSEPCRQTAMFGCIAQTEIDQLLEEFGDQLPPGFDLDRWPLVQLSRQNLSSVDFNGEGYRDLASLRTVKAQDWGPWGVVYHSQAGLEITEGENLSITTKLADSYLYQDPDWQPGGERILFQSLEGSHWEIFNINSDGAGIFALTRPPVFGGEQPHHVAPAWSPDGQWVVFAGNQGGEWGLWVMDDAGGNLQRLPLDVPMEYAFQAEQMVDWGP